ncbi:MAG: LPXTG cell wall anchor domain-containing protein [Prolixibacteraceae bacterium]|jgi:LPXTG-motif cell wall-anchored protein
MKKNIIRLTLAVMMLLNVAALALAQTTPKADKDTVNADKAAKPVFYQAADEEKSSGSSNTAIYIAAGVIVGAGVVFFLRKKKK